MTNYLRVLVFTVSKQMGKVIYETKGQQMVHNAVKKWIRKWKGILKYHNQVNFIKNENFCHTKKKLPVGEHQDYLLLKKMA